MATPIADEEATVRALHQAHADALAGPPLAWVGELMEAAVCEYCGDREGERLDRWGGWVCPACLAEGEALWRSSVGGAFAELYDRATAMGWPIGWWLRRKVKRAERDCRAKTKAALERALGKRLP